MSKTGAAVTCENGNILGGLHSAVSEAIAKYRPVPVLPIGIRDRFGEVGRLPYLKQIMGMTAEYIVQGCTAGHAAKEKQDGRHRTVEERRET